MTEACTIKYVPMRGDRDFLLPRNRKLGSVTMLPSIDEFQKKAAAALKRKRFTNLLMSDVISQESKNPDASFDISRPFRVEGRVGSIYARGTDTIDVGLETDFNDALLVAVSLNDKLYQKISGNITDPLHVFQSPLGEVSLGSSELSIGRVSIDETKDGGVVSRSIMISCGYYSEDRVQLTIGGSDVVGFILYTTEPTNPGTYNSPYITDSFAITLALSDARRAEEKMRHVIQGIANYALKSGWSPVLG